MLNRLYAKICNLRCPECNALQPVFLLSKTLRGPFLNSAVNGFALCPNCLRKLKLVWRASGLGLFFAGVGMALGMLLFALLVCAPLYIGTLSIILWLGMWGIVLFPILVLSLAFVTSAVAHRYYFPLFREVVAL